VADRQGDESVLPLLLLEFRLAGDVHKGRLQLLDDVGRRPWRNGYPAVDALHHVDSLFLERRNVGKPGEPLVRCKPKDPHLVPVSGQVVRRAEDGDEVASQEGRHLRGCPGVRNVRELGADQFLEPKRRHVVARVGTRPPDGNEVRVLLRVVDQVL